MRSIVGVFRGHAGVLSSEGNHRELAMLKDRQEILAVGELALFLATWVAVVLGSINHYRHREHLVPGDSVAAIQGSTENGSERK